METTMIPLATLRELFEYNYWARDRQLEACATLSQEEFQRSLGNSFSSVRDTLAHLVGAEWVWLERWRGRSPQALPAAEEFAALAAIAALWLTVEQGMREYLAGLNEEELARPLTYVNFSRQTWTYPLWRALLHLMNHQTYHRGQVTMMLRQLGKHAAPVDLLVADDEGLFDRAGSLMSA